MRRNISLVIITLIIVVLIALAFNLYQKNVEAERQIFKKELLIFQSHITGTVRAVNSKDSALMKDTLLRIKSLETFHSIEENSKAQLTVSAYEQGIKYLLDTNPSKYSEIKSDLRNIFNALTSHKDKKMNQEQFNKIINDVLPLVEQFRDNARHLLEE